MPNRTRAAHFADGQPVGPIVAREYHATLEDSGYAAGIAGKRLEESALWSVAWNGATTGTNFPAYIIAGWVAGRAIRRVREELSREA